MPTANCVRDRQSIAYFNSGGLASGFHTALGNMRA